MSFVSLMDSEEFCFVVVVFFCFVFFKGYSTLKVCVSEERLVRSEWYVMADKLKQTG